MLQQPPSAFSENHFSTFSPLTKGDFRSLFKLLGTNICNWGILKCKGSMTKEGESHYYGKLLRQPTK